MSALLTIGEVAWATGIKASAIRYYEEAGLLPEPERVGGKRRYDEEVLRRLALIRGAKRRVYLRRDSDSRVWLSRQDRCCGALAVGRIEEAG
jgi:predicted site-specific integrase-resolvase